MRVCYARDVWRMNGLRIRIRLVVLSNFHVENIFIRVTVFFMNFQRLNHFLELFQLTEITEKEYDVTMTWR